MHGAQICAAIAKQKRIQVAEALLEVPGGQVMETGARPSAGCIRRIASCCLSWLVLNGKTWHSCRTRAHTCHRRLCSWTPSCHEASGMTYHGTAWPLHTFSSITVMHTAARPAAYCSAECRR